MKAKRDHNSLTRYLPFTAGLFFGILLHHMSWAHENSAQARFIPCEGWQFSFAGNDTSNSYVYSDSLPVRRNVTLPHTFPRTDTVAGPPPVGIGWYYTTVAVTKPLADRDLFLEFDGVCLRAEIFVDGNSVGRSPFPYVPFRVDLTAPIRGKRSVRIAVKVDNRLRDGEFPDKRANGWIPYGGLVREVRLLAVPKQRIDRIALQTFYRTQDTFDFSIRLFRTGKPWDSVTVSLGSLTTPALVRAYTLFGSDTTIRISGIEAWTPDSPRLYHVVAVPWWNGKPGDTVRLRRGFCQMTVRGTSLLLNGKPVYLRGIGRHDVLDDADPLPDRQERLRDLLDCKALGINFLRIAHFPQSREVYELCDSLGIMVMDEMPVWKSDAEFLGSTGGVRYGVAYLNALIEAHGNHTSIVLWSIGNQFASFQPAVAAYVQQVTTFAKKNDPSRLVTYCSYHYLWDKGFRYVDVISINEYFGWELASLPMLSMMLDKLHQDWPQKPVIVSEFGPQAAYGLRNPQPQLAGVLTSVLSKDLSEDHQALYLQSHIDTIWSRRSFVSGMAIWAYADYRSGLNKARTPDMPPGLNACGLVTERREKKLAHDIVRERYLKIRDIFSQQSEAVR